MFGLLVRAAVLCALLWAIWKVLRYRVLRSPLDNIPGPPAKSFWRGSFPQFYNTNGWRFHKEIAERYGDVVKITALFGESQLYVSDPKALHHILVKDQEIFEPSAFIAMNRLTFGEGILATIGDQHRKQRKMLNPVFSIVHMREIVPVFYDVTYKLRDTILKKVTDGPQEIDMMSWMTRTALELISQSGLGYSFDPLTDDDVPHPYTLAAKQLIPAVFGLRFVNTYFNWLFTLGPAKFRRFVVEILPIKKVQDMKSVVDVLHNTSVDILKVKKKALKEGDEAMARQIGQGKDLMSILLRANMAASRDDSLTESELLGQMTSLVFAAMDTTSTALSRTLDLLSNNQDAQDALRTEITEARKANGGDLDYDELVSLPYLDAICRETLRLHPPIPVVRRTTLQDVVIPITSPIKGVNGQEIRELHIPANTDVSVGVMIGNRNPELWGPDAEEWKPERWLNPLPDTVINARIPGVYSNLLTFISGSRSCIGFKFSQLEMKVVLSVLVESFRFYPSKKDIFWRMTGITSPVVIGDDTGAQLPIVVERVA
ncbi:cytochrome P450 [Pholiota conissans]|uniref:Cytochrome P450 n=1 Tax=Pholiota conissans TaxID=109636 RepID=A0A9P5Z7Q2_9AGAR|nr:cytochrome P450 [Pholiota conissans]